MKFFKCKAGSLGSYTCKAALLPESLVESRMGQDLGSPPCHRLCGHWVGVAKGQHFLTDHLYLVSGNSVLLLFLTIWLSLVF